MKIPVHMQLITFITGIGRMAIFYIIMIINWESFSDGSHLWYVGCLVLFAIFTHIDFKNKGLYPKED